MRTELQIDTIDIANPGFGPIWAPRCLWQGREYVFTDPRVLSTERAFVERFVNKVAAKGAINPVLWEATSLTDAERAINEYGQIEREYYEDIHLAV
jgi:hypothetical protein